VNTAPGTWFQESGLGTGNGYLKKKGTAWETRSGAWGSLPLKKFPKEATPEGRIHLFSLHASECRRIADVETA
jgi:hypothetical protein